MRAFVSLEKSRSPTALHLSIHLYQGREEKERREAACTPGAGGSERRQTRFLARELEKQPLLLQQHFHTTSLLPFPLAVACHERAIDSRSLADQQALTPAVTFLICKTRVRVSRTPRQQVTRLAHTSCDREPREREPQRERTERKESILCLKIRRLLSFSLTFTV